MEKLGNSGKVKKKNKNILKHETSGLPAMRLSQHSNTIIMMFTLDTVTAKKQQL